MKTFLKKGFTLVELLVVLVIVAILVAASVPKYRAAMEKARGIEAITNLKNLGDLLNARYLSQGNTYCMNGDCSNVQAFLSSSDKTHGTFFDRIVLDGAINSNEVVVSTERETGDYALYLKVKDGDSLFLCCSGEQSKCKLLGGEFPPAGTPCADVGLELKF